MSVVPDEVRPRFLVLWSKARHTPKVPIAWAPSTERARMIIAYFPAKGWWRVQDLETGATEGPWRKQ